MQIQIKNIWKIKNAIINLDWLSVIAWNNDTWKSTVWKLVFSVIKAFQKYKDFSEISKENIIKKQIDEIYSLWRILFNILRDEKKTDAWTIFKKFKENFYPDIFLEELENSNNKKEFFNKKKEIILWLLNDSYTISRLLEEFEVLEKEFFKEETKEYLIEKALNNILESEFKNWLNELKEQWYFIAKDWELPLFEIIFKWTKVQKIKIDDDIIKIQDSVFTESPIILNFFNDFYSSDKIQYHIKDLFKKIVSINESKWDRVNWLWKKIEDIIKWTFELRKRIVWFDLSFKKEWIDRKIEPINTATGIKSFWVLDLLDQSWNLNKETLLILDEPEVHLHPEWQVKYANLITELIKERQISVLITSHSPYMIEALSKYSKELKINASFYLSEENWKWKCVIEDKTEKKYEIFEKLSKPFKELILK